MNGYIHQLNISQGGVPKRAVAEAWLTPEGLADDVQADRRYHGGPERALCLFALELIEELRTEGHAIFPGATGENVTVAGLGWSQLAPGSRLALGDEVVIEISSYAAPCQTISGSFIKGESKRISQKIHPGQSRLYARVIKAGRLAPGQPVRVLKDE